MVLCGGHSHRRRCCLSSGLSYQPMILSRLCSNMAGPFFLVAIRTNGEGSFIQMCLG